MHPRRDSQPFALDLGVDREDVVGALDALVDGRERPVDLAEVNGQVFVNNVSLGVYAALRRGRELALLQLVGATRRQVRSMARWEAVLIVAIGLGVGLAIAATALLPLSHALTGSLRPYVPTARSP